jgi:hypothetical protein
MFYYGYVPIKRKKEFIFYLKQSQITNKYLCNVIDEYINYEPVPSGTVNFNRIWNPPLDLKLFDNI